MVEKNSPTDSKCWEDMLSIKSSKYLSKAILSSAFCNENALIDSWKMKSWNRKISRFQKYWNPEIENPEKGTIYKTDFILFLT